MTETQVQANGLRRPKGISCGDAAGVWLKAAERGDSGKRYQGLPVTGSSPGSKRAPSLARTPGWIRRERTGTEGPGLQQASPHRVRASEGGAVICSPERRAQLIPVHTVGRTT